MALGSGLRINPDKFNWLVHNIDPTPLQAEIDQVAAGGAMDMSGSAASPLGIQPQQGMDWASIFGNAPQGGGMAPIDMSALMGAMQPQGTSVPRAPAAAPQKPGMINMQPPQIPRGLKPVPQLSQLLGGV